MQQKQKKKKNRLQRNHGHGWQRDEAASKCHENGQSGNTAGRREQAQGSELLPGGYAARERRRREGLTGRDAGLWRRKQTEGAGTVSMLAAVS